MSSESEPRASGRRPYRLKERARRQDETRGRIAAATASLHEQVGPARTTIAEIARRAGVRRPTVYNNFPSERELFEACRAHFLGEHPPPDPGPALALADPYERIRAALEGLYGWYRSNAAMTGNVQRDRGHLPALDEILAETSDRPLELLADALARPFADARAPAFLRLAVQFATWDRLAAEGLADAEAAALMADAAGAVAARPA